MTSPDIDRRVKDYQIAKNAIAEFCLGIGTQGSVFAFRNLSHSERFAVKFHERERAYYQELDVYLRLRELQIDSIRGHVVPQLLHYDDELLAIEMTIVSPPFCLDFGGAYLDRPPEYSPEVWADWREMKSEAFENNWPKVESILAEFRSYGIYIADVNPGNIRFE